MIIKRVKLKNYRSHSNTEVEFSRGINLILGQNGRGKSSILEALSIAMLNVKDRTGNKNSKKNYIKFGEKEASVEIDFIANDGKEYKLNSKFSEKAPKKTLSDEDGIEYNKDVDEKLKELCGIKKGLEETYENIVIAKQNEFINIFKDTAGNREKIFNKIFNTQIYKEMSDKYLKLACDKYSEEKKGISKEIEILSQNMEDREEIFSSLNLENENKKKLNEEITKNSEIKEKLEEKIKKYEKIENDLKTLSLEYKNTEISLEKNKKIFKENIASAKKSKGAKKILIDNEKGYDEYLKLDATLKQERNIYEDLLTKEKLNLKYKSDIEKFYLEIENEEKNIINSKAEIQKNQEKKEEISQEISSLKTKEKNLHKDVENLWNIYTELKGKTEEKNSLETKNSEKIGEIKSLEDIIKNKNPLFEKIRIEELEENIENLAKIEQKLESLKFENIFLDDEVKSLKTSREYFLRNLKPLVIELEKNISLEKQKYEKTKKEQENLEKSKLSIEKFMSERLKENNFNSLEELKTKGNEIKAEIKALNIPDKEKSLKEIIKEIEKYEKKLRDFDDRIRRTQSSIEEYKSKIIPDLEELIKTKNIRIKDLEQDEKELKISYNLYLENKALADNLNLFCSKIKENLEELSLLRRNKNVLTTNIDNLKKLSEENNIEDDRREYKTIQEKISEMNKSLGSVEEKIENYNKLLKEISEQEIKLKSMRKNLKNLENKSDKANIIREQVGKMGKEISKYMLSNISNLASLNFNKITGRAERIEWSNEGEDKYAVYLVGEEKRIPFEQLSGGEQVSVAIAIRGTMTQYFTNSKFMILDEPTNNLDMERKKLLAEYVGEVLKNLDQSIIVTHDDTFREMAEKIIEL